ncbi:BrnT family toxin [Jiella endophytica]|uniref:BrnT family toxin n=1 Tax=Jiella endophytica TaxID=2558362 RepID=A0A4Y8R8L4_9HYPH|nr:BrnT family toxin [Jiella endophytica]TFF17949.1 BrnT family toxin [Jiella endophytica]
MAEFEWDDHKRAGNLAKHGVDFALARRFDLKTADIEADVRHAYGEERFQAKAPIDDRLYVMVFTYRGDAVRVISLRKANEREVLRYEKKTSANPSDP